MGLLCCLSASDKAGNANSRPTLCEAKGLVEVDNRQPSSIGHGKGNVSGPLFSRTSVSKDGGGGHQRRTDEPHPRQGSIAGRLIGPPPLQRSSGPEALLQLLTALTSLEGGWWDQLERALAATAQHLSATHACIFVISGEPSYASPLALVGPPAPPLCIGTPLPLALTPAPGQVQVQGGGHGPAGPASATPCTSTAAPAAAGAGAAAAGSAAAGGPSCAAAALLAEQDGDGLLLMFAEASAAAAGRSGGGGGCCGLPPSAPPEWRHLAAAEPSTSPGGTAAAAAAATCPGGDGAARHCGGGGGCRHFAAVTIPAGQHSMGALSLGAEGSGRPASWTPEALHCTAAMLSAPLRAPQVDLACRALAELSSAATVHQLVRTLLGAASELMVTVTRIETQARVAFLQPDVEAAAVFQSAATDALGPSVRRRLSEVLLVDTSAAAGGGGGLATVASGGGGLLGVLGGLLGGGGRASLGGPAAGGPMRRSLGGTEAVPGAGAAGAGASRSPSVGPADGHRDSFARGPHAATSEELSVCRGHSLPLKHTLLSEALAQGTGLCIADCNAYVQDSKVYPRDLAVSRGAAPPQSLALATCCHSGKPLLALYATYHSILPQALLQAVVQELGQLLRALTASVAAKVEGDLAAEWGYLRHQLLESMRNRSLRSLHGCSASDTAQQQRSAAAAAALAATTVNGSGTSGAGGAAGHLPNFNSPANAASAADNNNVGSIGGGGSAAAAANGTLAALLAAGVDSPAHPRSVASTGCLLLPGGGVAVEGAGAGGGGGASGSTGLLGLERSRGAGGGGGGGGGGRDGRNSGRASFCLEAASSPRGSSKLAPLIATLHDRLKAAQTEQMANCRASSRMQDLESIRILEQIGRGGYGVVYRGLYHGSEVAIKVIQEAEVAPHGAPGDGGGGDGPLRRLNSVALENKHLHDAIELVASVGMGGHPNIVQVLTFFTDVCVMVGDEPVEAPGLHRRLSGLDGVAELLRLTRMPSALDQQQHQQQQQPPALADHPADWGPGAGGAGGQQQGPGAPANGQHQGEGHHAPRGSGVIVLVQEFCDAGTLKNAINQRAFYRNVAPSGEERQSRVHLQLNLKAVYSTLLEVALALRHMHGLHMVHCDLKPQNVLLKSSPRDPRGFTAKLSDFGLAKMMAHDDEGRLVIDDAVGSGTLTHMAPESLAGQKHLNASIDMFAFGILMWQMVCGTRLYQGLSTKQIIRGVVRENLRPAFPAWVPAEYRRLAERCWHPTPSDRPTAGAVVAELEAMVDTHSRAAASAASAAAAAAAAAGWRAPMRVSNHGVAATAAASSVESPGSPRHLPHPHPHPQQLHQMQQLQQLQQQQQQQQATATAVAAGKPGSNGAHLPWQHPQQQPHPQQQQQLAASLGPQRAGSYTGMSPMRPLAASGLGPGGRLII